MQLPQGIPSPPPAGPPNAMTRSRREYHYSCFFHGEQENHSRISVRCDSLGFKASWAAPPALRLLSLLCCSKTRLCNLSCWIFNYLGPLHRGKWELTLHYIGLQNMLILTLHKNFFKFFLSLHHFVSTLLFEIPSNDAISGFLYPSIR